MEVEIVDEEDFHPMTNHISVRLGDSVLLFSGYHFINEYVAEYISHYIIYQYITETEKWIMHTIPKKQNVPPPTAEACAAVVNDDIYMFGGSYCPHSQCSKMSFDAFFNKHVVCTNMLWKLSRKAQSFQWTKMTKCDPRILCPRRQASAWGYMNKFWAFGGSSKYWQWDIRYLGKHEYYCNELISFDVIHRKWETEKHTGAIPSERHGHATALMNDTLYLFGGRCRDTEFDDLYELHMPTLTWTTVQVAGLWANYRPVARHFHTLTAISDKYIALHGGQDTSHGFFSDTWLFDVTSLTWKMCQTAPENRSCHTATCKENGSLIIVGGRTTDNMGDTWDCSTVYHFHDSYQPKGLQYFAVKAVHMNQHLLQPREWNMPNGTWQLLHDL